MPIRGSIAFITAIWSAFALAAAMLGIGVFQSLIQGIPVRQLVIEHGLHVVIFGGLIHVVLNFTLRRTVAVPIREIGSHLYGIGAGQVATLQLDSPVSEIRQMVDSVNLMVNRLEMRTDVANDIAYLQTQLERLPLAQEKRLEMQERLERLRMFCSPS